MDVEGGYAAERRNEQYDADAANTINDDTLTMPNEWGCAIQCILKDDIDGLLKILEEKPHFIGMSDSQDMDFLMCACLKGKFEIAKRLVAMGSNLNAVENLGQTALHLSVMTGHTDVSKFLLDNEADINAKSYDKWTPLIWAAARGHTDTVRMLLERNSDARAKDGKGYT